jgi:hypothetical protein
MSLEMRPSSQHGQYIRVVRLDGSLMHMLCADLLARKRDGAWAIGKRAE